MSTFDGIQDGEMHGRQVWEKYFKSSFLKGVRTSLGDLHPNASDWFHKWSVSVEAAASPPGPPASAPTLLGAQCGWCRRRSSLWCPMPAGRGVSCFLMCTPPWAKHALSSALSAIRWLNLTLWVPLSSWTVWVMGMWFFGGGGVTCKTDKISYSFLINPLYYSICLSWNIQRLGNKN